MSSNYYKLTISDRLKLGNRESKKVRNAGFIPAVIYYAGEKSTHISIDKSVFFHALQSSQRVYEIDKGKEKFYVMIKEIQYHPVTDEIIHVDLMRVRRSEKMTIVVPLVLIGEPIGVKEGGILSQALNQIEISCYPTDVPEHIELKIDDLEINAALSVGDIDTGSEDIELISDASLNIVSITTPVSEEAVDEEVEEDEDSDGEDGSDEKVDESSEERSDDKTEN